MQSASNMTLRELINSVDSEQYSDSALYKKLRETKPEYGANRRIQVNKELKKIINMAYMNRFSLSDEGRRDELIRIIEHSVEKLTLAELEALYYDMTTKSYIND